MANPQKKLDPKDWLTIVENTLGFGNNRKGPKEDIKSPLVLIQILRQLNIFYAEIKSHVATLGEMQRSQGALFLEKDYPYIKAEKLKLKKKLSALEPEVLKLDPIEFEEIYNNMDILDNLVDKLDYSKYKQYLATLSTITTTYLAIKKKIE